MRKGVNPGRTPAAYPLWERNKCPQRPSSRGPLSAPAGEASRGSRRAEWRRQVRGTRRGSDPRGLPGVGVRVLSSAGVGGRDLPHHSFLLTSPDLGSRFPDSRGTGPGTGRRRQRYPEARCEWTAFGCAALPELCGARTALRCTPPRHRLPRAAEGSRFISAKVLLLLFFVQRTALFIGGRPGVSPGVCGAHSPPRLHGLTLQGQPAPIWVPPASPRDRSAQGLAPAS